jgi:hypothetical protein
MSQRKPILAMSDLSTRSDAAVQFAGRLAHVLGAELSVLHALGLTNRPLRAVMPARKDIHSTLRSIDRTLRAQIQRAAPHLLTTKPPVVDIDRPAEALRRHLAELNPMVAITPDLWDWSATRATFADLEHPVLIIREPRHQTHDRVLIISTNETFRDEMVEAAGRWAFWLEHVYNCTGAIGGPHFEVLALDDDDCRRELDAGGVNRRVDLIVIDKAILDLASVPPQRDLVSLLRRTVAPVAVLAHAASGPSFEHDARVVTHQRVERLEA